MIETDSYSTWVEIDLKAIESNLRYFAETTRTEIMAVVKAEAYGHDAIHVAETALTAGARWLGVARVGEALKLRQALGECSILVLGWCPPARLGDLIQNQISLTYWSESQLVQITQAAEKVGKQAKVHLKVDTGMNRVGSTPDDGIRLAQMAADHAQVDFEGVSTHFARADEIDSAPTDIQLQIFERFLTALNSAGLRPAWIHCANSAAALSREDARYDLLRIGIAMYGLRPSVDRPLPGSFQPALSWKSTLAQVKSVPPGQGISYGHVYSTTAQERIGTIPVGYADGFRRVGDNEVLVGGKRVPVIGRVTMDQIMVQLDSVPAALPGDEVVIIGSQGEERITAEEIAIRWGTISYEVTSGISHRVPRVFSGDRTS